MIVTIGKPNPKQVKFLQSRAVYTAYGGARGGGKTWAVREKARLLASRYSGITILILRRTRKDLLRNHIYPLLNLLVPLGARWDAQDKILWFNESQIIFGYCDNDNDLRQYQGQEYDIIFIDEATQFKWEWFDALKACNRGANEFPHRMYLTCNPGDIGHAWVKRLFIDREYLSDENPDDYAFIPATVYDNKELIKNDPGYVKKLESLGPGKREAWLLGSWDVFEGQYFREWDPSVHVVADFVPPASWRRYFTMDYGLDMLAGYVIAVSPTGEAYVCKELYKPELIISEAAREVKSLCAGEDVFQYFAPPDLWNRRQDTGKSVAEIFGEHGIYLTKAQNERVAGWMNMKEWLKVDVQENGERRAGLRVMQSCRNLIRCIPLLQYDQKKTNDCATEPHEITHAPDAIRYFCAGRPMADAPEEPKKAPLPFALRDVEDYTGGLMNW